MSKVLFIRPRNKTGSYPLPHVGLATLSSILQEKGHKVMVLDYLLFADSGMPEIKDVIKDFNPDIIGISIYTATFGVCSRILEDIRYVTEAPIMVGGPHASLYAEELLGDKI